MTDDLKTLHTNGIRLAYTATGDAAAAPMVLLHGGGGSHADWDVVGPALARDHRVYAVDLRGHGASEWPAQVSYELMRDDVAGLVEALGLDPFVLIGHSMGGVVAWLFAEEYPDRLTHLVIEDVSPPRVGDPERKLPPRPDHELPFDYAALAAVFAQLSRADPAWWERTAGIAVPVLIIGGGPESHIDQARLAELADRIPGARLVTLASSHHVHQDRPDDYLATVAGFLA